MSTKTLSISTQLINLFFAQFNQKDYLAGNPSYKWLSNGKVIVSIPYYSTLALSLQYDAPRKRKALATAISHVMTSSAGHKVEKVEIRVIKLRFPYLDREILAKYTALNARKYPFARIHKTVFKKRAFFLLPTGKKSSLFNDHLPYSSKGIKLELAGRLTTQKSIPRKTVANKHIGSGLSRNQVNKGHFRYTSKNKLGANTIKV